MISELHDIFPNLTERKIWKILLAIKFRYMKYGTVGLSRLEAARFGTSERQVQAFIKYLRNIDAIRKVRTSFTKTGYSCNVYSLSQWFIDGLKEVKEFVKKKFEYIDPLAYVKSKFTTKKEGNKIKFKVNGDRYVIHTSGRFEGKVYDVGNKCIINPLTLGKN